MRTVYQKNKMSPTFGPQWHSFWVMGRVEPNRKIYDYELVYFSSGCCKVVFESQMFECPAGTVIIIPPNMLHCTIAMSRAERWCVHFDWFGDCLAHQTGQRIFVYSDDNEIFNPTLVAADPGFEKVKFPFVRENVSPEIMPLLKRYFLCTEDRFDVRMERQGLLLQILSIAFRPSPGIKIHTISNKAFFEAKNIIDANYLDPELKIGEIAGELRISPNYLTKLFRKMLGMPVVDYLHVRRLENSCELLKHSNMTVREVAFASGFNDANYFSRIFKKIYGETPMSMRLKEIKRDNDQDDFIY